jgi:hypothetical protein
VPHYRDSRGGDFYLDRDRASLPPPSAELPLVRFAGKNGAVCDLWSGDGADEQSVLPLLRKARLDWRVDHREVLTPLGDPWAPTPIRGYEALVRPGPDSVMSVVTSAYRVAENEWVARAALALGLRFDPGAVLVAAAGFGRTGERTLFVVRVRELETTTLILLAHNTHGGEGAVRFQLVEADRSVSAILAPDSRHATLSIPHVGDVEERLDDLRVRSIVEDYVAETQPAWGRLQAAPWTPRHTSNLLHELWGEPPQSERALRHPARHLTSVLADCSDPAEAYRLVCAYLDNESEACERGDFTKDRDERLALGAGLKLKQRAWRWMIDEV